MGKLAKNDGGGLVSLLHGKGGNLVIPKPFTRDIFLFETHIAGTNYVTGIKEIEPHLHIDEKLEFYREPDNEYDKMAIVIKTSNGVKIGYVPKADNSIFSRLMDAGKLLSARMASKEMVGNWLKIDIKVFLHE
jgi:hypothetical protein